MFGGSNPARLMVAGVLDQVLVQCVFVYFWGFGILTSLFSPSMVAILNLL